MNSNLNTTDCSKPVPEVVPFGGSVGQGRVAGGVSRVSSQALLAGANEVEIEHHGALYRLRLTSLGKLILTK